MISKRKPRFSCPQKTDEVVCVVSIKREHFQLAGPMTAKEGECCDPVILSLYVFIPSSRGLEMKPPQIVKDPGSMDVLDLRECNVLMLRQDRVVLPLNDNKTRKSSGSDELTIKT